MSRVWQSPVPGERPVVPRPGALLSAAAAVPLGAAVLLAAALLPAGARIAVGAALAVLGWRIRAEATTALGARAGGPTLRAIGLAALVLGLLLAAGGGAVVVVDLVADESVAEGLGPSGIGAGAAATLAALVAAAGAAAAAVASSRIGALVTGAGGALLLHGLTGLEALDLSGGTRTAVLLVAAVLVAVEGLRRGAGDDVGRGLLLAAGVLVVVTHGEATQLLEAVAEGAVPWPERPGSAGGRGAQAAVAAGVAVALLIAAVRRRDAAIGVLPLGILLLDHDVAGTAEKIGVLLVPGVVAVAIAAGLAGAGPLRDRFDRDALRAALMAAVLVLLDHAAAVLPRASDAGVVASNDVSVLGLVLGGAAVVVLLAGVALARRVPGGAGAASGVIVLVALVAASPLERIQLAGPGGWFWSVLPTVIVALLAVAVGAAVLARRREPIVVAAAALLLGSALARVAQVVAFRGAADDDPGLAGLLAAQLGPAVLLAVVAGAVALLGPPAVLARAQAAGAALLYLAALAASGAAQLLQTFGFVAAGEDGPTAALLGGGSLVVGVALLLLLAVAASLLAASTARRPSPVVAVAGVGAVLGTAVYAAALGAAASASAFGSDDAGEVMGAAQPSAAGLALGLRTLAPFGRDVGAGWPVLLGVLGAALLAAAWWLESRRPAPPGAPVG